MGICLDGAHSYGRRRWCRQPSWFAARRNALPDLCAGHAGFVPLIFPSVRHSSSFEDRPDNSLFETAFAASDPVFLLSTGHSYERSSIATWLKNHNTCPMTRQKLTSKAVLQNWGLKSAIRDWQDKAAQVGDCLPRCLSLQI